MLTTKQIKVLIVDDDEDDFFIIAGYIKDIQKEKFIVDWCKNYQEALNKFRNKEYDIYFVDYRLGHQTGLELLGEMADEKLNVPVVLLTGKGSKDIDIKAMQSGATDYLVKSDLNVEKLERCIRYSLDRAASLNELKTRENKYRNLFEGSKDAVVITTEDLTMLEVNYAASQLFCLSMKELAGKSIYNFIKDESQKNLLRQQLERRDAIDDLELEIMDSNKETKACLVSMTFMEQSTGEHLIHAIIHDITNIKKAEIANLQAQKLAANERLMRILAHEIRNPLNNISLSIDHFDIPESTDTQKNLVSIIQRNCVRINHIITELLDLTKPPELTFKKHSLQDILDESIAMISDKTNLRHITVNREYPSDPLEISANKSKLVIAFTNILVNAIEATQDNVGEISVSVKEVGNTYHVSIKDNGMGIPEEYLSKLFEPFFTLKKNGVGLGLAASYSIIHSHKANMRVESEVDKGTNFIISFNAA